MQHHQQLDDQDIPTLLVADSKFLGFAKIVDTKSEAASFQKLLKRKYHSAAHVAYCWVSGEGEGDFDEDGEPFSSCGVHLLNETKVHFDKYMKNESDRTLTLVLAIVRFFGNQLLGVTCGRLSQCYHSIATLTLHRFFHGKDVQLHQNFVDEPIDKSKYGLGAGDCEVILNVISEIDGSDDKASFLKQIVNELNFGGFKGSEGKELPRLQNLQVSFYR